MPRAQRAVTITTRRDGGSALLSVSGDGPGIAVDQLNEIFRPFFSTKRDGMGMSISRTIVKAHGGTVTVKSEPGKGTEFVMRIPAAPMEKMDEFADSANRR